MKRNADNRRSPAEIKYDLQRHYGGLEHGNADMTDFRRLPYSVRHPDTGYSGTHNMSIKQQSVVQYIKSEYNTQNTSTGKQNVAEYPESECGTQNMSMAGKLIWAQGEQIRHMSAEEYLKNKMGSGADGYNKRAAAGISE